MPVHPDDAIRFIENLKNTKGKFAGKNFVVYEFQARIIRTALALDPKTGRRMLREFLLGVARKNGKTELIAALAIVLLVLDGEPGGEVVVAAGKRDQARILLDAAKKMVRLSSIGGRPLTDFLRVQRDGIFFPELDSRLIAVSADAQNEQGLNPHAAIVDELHVAAEKKRDLYDALYTAQDARENPIMISLTTAGPVPAGPCYDLYQYGREHADDPDFKMLWYEAPEEIDLDDDEQVEHALRAANPAYGHFLFRENLWRKVRDVRNGRMPEYVFRRLHLNQWTTAAERWLPYAKWKACGAPPEIPDGAEVWLGIDAAIRRDTFCVGLVYVEPDAVEVFEDDDTVPRKRSIVHVTARRFVPDFEGGYIDPADVVTYVLGLASRYRIMKVAYDPAYMTLLSSELAERGLPMQPFPQSAERMTAATEIFQRVVLDGRLRHGNDRMLSEQMAAVGVKPTERGVRVSKTSSGLPIDAIISIIMPMALALEAADEPEDFAYVF